MTGALNNLDKKLGSVTDLLVQIFEQKQSSVNSAEDKRSSGNERRVASNVESGRDQSTRNRKRQNPSTSSFEVIFKLSIFSRSNLINHSLKRLCRNNVFRISQEEI